jgi:hypothetical protein
MVQVQICELDALFSSLLSSGLGFGNQGMYFTKGSEIILN